MSTAKACLITVFESSLFQEFILIGEVVPPSLVCHLSPLIQEATGWDIMFHDVSARFDASSRDMREEGREKRGGGGGSRDGSHHVLHAEEERVLQGFKKGVVGEKA